MLNQDPLNITYVVVHAEDSLEEMSPLQGFGESWPSTLWALRVLAVAPASIPERGWPLKHLIAQRMGGGNLLNWRPLTIDNLEKIGLDDLGFVTVLMTGTDDVAKRVASWCEKQPRPALQVRENQIANDSEAIAFCDGPLLEHCRLVVDGYSEVLPAPFLDAARQGLESWMRRQRIPTKIRQVGHNLALPNEMVFTRAERTLLPGKPFIGRSESEYDEIAVQGARAVLDLRAENGFFDFNRKLLPRPGLILTEPALYRHVYAAKGDRNLGTKPFRDWLRRIRKQTGLWNTVTPEEIAILNNIQAQAIIGMRQKDLATHFHGVGLMAAQTCSAVLRLRPGVNHVFPALLRFASNVRADNSSKSQKTLKLFDEVQGLLADSIGDMRNALIANYSGSIKIVSDSPLELLRVGDLTLALRNDVSRINSTPGNLMMGELIPTPLLSVTPEELSKVLIISGFRDEDPLKNMMKDAIDRIKPEFADKAAATFIKVKTRTEFVEALNGSDAFILIFDGHGRQKSPEGIGGIEINGDFLDVWNLRGEARIPPIVILSACETQRIDAPTHATAGNGFLNAGALTVLATLLPIDGTAGADFIARLLRQLSRFIPAALGLRQRCVNWNEVISILLRLTLAIETIAALVKDANQANKIKTAANFDVNLGDPNWYESLLSRIAATSGNELEITRSSARVVMARSEAIRYVQLGSPEAIIIDDGSIEKSIFRGRTAHSFGVG